MKRSVTGCALFLLLASIPLPAAAEGTAAGDEPVGRTLAIELARLDERLALGTDPDGTGDWLARLAAVLEYRVRQPEAALGSRPAAAPDLMRRLAEAVRTLGVEEDLEPPPGAEPTAPDEERAARLRATLAAARLLHAKLDPPPAAPGLPAALPANDSCAAATVLVDGSVGGTTAGASNDGTASCGSSDTSADVWFRYTAAADGWRSFDTLGSSFDTVLSVLDGCPGSGQELACNDDSGGTVHSKVSLEMTAGQEVWLRVSGFGGGAGSFTLTAGAVRGLEGTVTAAATGAPVAGAQVKAYNEWGWFLDGAATAADGTYLIGGLAAGTRYAQVSNAPGLIDETWDDLSCPSWRSCWPDDGTPITVAEGITSGIDFALSPGGTLSGVLTDAATSEPLAGYVRLYGLDGRFLTSIYTGSGGIYELTGVPVGKYYLWAEASGYRRELYDDLPCPGSCSITSGTQVAVLADTTTGADFALDRLGAVTGRLTEDPSGASIASQRVVVSSPSFYRSAYTTSDGSYEAASLPEGSYSVWTETFSHRNELYDGVVCAGSCSSAAGGTPVAVVLNGEVSGIDFALQRLGAIGGSVLHGPTSQPLQNVQVVARSTTGDVVRSSSSLADGSYVIHNLPAGSYRVQTDSSWWSGQQADELYDDVPCWDGCDPADATLVAVTLATTTSGVDFRLDLLGTLEGTVVAADTGLSVGGEVLLYDASGSVAGSTYSYSGFRFTRIRPGTYHVATSGSSSGYQGELYRDVPCEPACDRALGTPFTLALNGAVLGVDFVLQPCPGDSYTSVVGTRFLSTHVADACERLTAGSGTVVDAGADVTFRAGTSVVLGSGFAVRRGGRLRVAIEPTWAQP